MTAHSGSIDDAPARDMPHTKIGWPRFTEPITIFHRVPGMFRRLPVITAATSVATAATVGVLAFVTPGYFVHRVFDTTALQQGVATVLTRDFKIDVATVACPDRVPVTAGLRFSCNALLGGSGAGSPQDQIPVPVRVVDRDGTFEVSRPF